MSAGPDWVDALRIARDISIHKGLTITNFFIDKLVGKLSEPGASFDDVLEVIELSLEGLMVEIREGYPSHFEAIVTFVEELGIATSGRPEGEPQDLWDCLEGRGDIQKVGNMLIDKINLEKSPEAKTLLIGQYLMAMYEAQSASFTNVINFILNDYRDGIGQESTHLVQTVLTLDGKQRDMIRSNPDRSRYKCELYHIRNGFAHFRYEISANGDLHIWDMRNSNTNSGQRNFERKYSLPELMNMVQEFQNRVDLFGLLTCLVSFQTMIETMQSNGFGLNCIISNKK